MTPFTKIESVAAVLDEDEIDTDIIFPARFLLLLDKSGLGKHAFHERRNVWPRNAPFILDTPPYDKARIFVAGANFGTGSSREQAVWAMADFGIRCIIAPSFGEIFRANCFKNGVLPIVKTGAELAAIREAASAGKSLTIDLEAQTIKIDADAVQDFSVEPFHREALLGGLDEIGSILGDDGADIQAFEHRQRAESPWLYLGPDQLSYFDDLEKENALG